MQDELNNKRQQRELAPSDLAPPDEESALPSRRSQAAFATEEETELETAPGSTTSSRFGSWGRSAQAKDNSHASETNLSPRLSELVAAFHRSDVSKGIANDAGRAEDEAATDRDADGEEVDIPLQGYKRATLWTQFTILSSRAFKNLYRNPMLMLSHYALSAVLGGTLLLL